MTDETISDTVHINSEFVVTDSSTIKIISDEDKKIIEEVLDSGKGKWLQINK